MSMQGRISRAYGKKVKRALGVQALLEWTFRVEKAQLELPPPKDVVEEGYGFGLEYVLMQRAALGCKVDGGQHKMGSYTHADAEVIAAIVATARWQIEHALGEAHPHGPAQMARVRTATRTIAQAKGYPHGPYGGDAA